MCPACSQVIDGSPCAPRRASDDCSFYGLGNVAVRVARGEQKGRQNHNMPDTLANETLDARIDRGGR